MSFSRKQFARRLTTLLALGTSLAGAGLPAQDRPQQRPNTAARADPSPGRRVDTRPNIILIMADDFGVEGVNSYGGEYHTPNIDRLAREGMRFDNAHATPLCTPSRTRIMTGLENHRNYQAFGHLAPGQFTFGNLLSQAGYATAIVGKWQLSGNGFDGRVGITPAAAGFAESFLWQLQVRDAKGSRYWGPTRSVGDRTRISEEGFGPDADQAFALDFIERHKDRPFLLYYPMVLVHNPFVPTPATLDAAEAKERFAGMVAYMDRQVGALMQKLRDLGLDDDTVVMFTGDNGTNRQIASIRNGYEIRGDKGRPTLNGTHVPLIVRAPGRVPPNRVSQALFDFTDVLPTLAELTSTKLPLRPFDGVSQAPVLSGAKASVRDSIFLHYAPVWMQEPARLIFDAHYKLYGDGRFVSLNPVSGVETPLDTARLTGEAARRHAEFRRSLDEMKDGPLNTDRYPMCAGQPSSKSGEPAIKAGCAALSQVDS